MKTMIARFVAVLCCTALSSLKAATIADDIASMGFAPGIAAIYTVGGDNVDSVSLQNNIVRVKKKSRARISPVFESHYLFGADRGGALDIKKDLLIAGATEEYANDIAFGPTVMIELGENVVRSAGIGFMMSGRKVKVTKSGSDIILTKVGVAFNVSVIALIEQNAKKLGDGLVDGQEIPAIGMELTREVYRPGVGVMFSASF